MENSKFAPIVKVKKQQRDKVETLLAKARYEKQELEQELVMMSKEMSELHMPKSGSISLMSMSRERLGIMRRGKELLKQSVMVKQSEIDQLIDKHKRAHLEFEKMKYLEDQDFAQKIEEIKKKEQLDMDEISNILFVNKGLK